MQLGIYAINHMMSEGRSYRIPITGTGRRLKQSKTTHPQSLPGLFLNPLRLLLGCPRPSPDAISSWEINVSTLEDSGNETTDSVCHCDLTRFHFLSGVSHACLCVYLCSGTPAGLQKAVYQCQGSSNVINGT